MKIDRTTRLKIVTRSDWEAAREGCRYDQRAPDRVERFFRRYLRHWKGKHAGKPFDLLGWQMTEVIEPIFGWLRPDGSRRFRRVFIAIPKKNGKSTLAAGVALYLTMADGERGAQVYCVAHDRSQAQIVHGEAVAMAEFSPQIAPLVKVHQNSYRLLYPSTRSTLQALSSESGGKHGLDAHGFILDELHAWRGRKLYDSLRYGIRARRQPLIFQITTAGDDEESLCYQVYRYAAQVRDDEIVDTEFYPLIYESDPIADDWEEEQVWLRTNPSLGHTLQLDDLRADHLEAKQMPPAERAFRRYTLNQWLVGDAGAWEAAELWPAAEVDKLPEPEESWLGLDLARSRDTCSLAEIWDGPDDTICCRIWHWMPERRAHQLRDFAPYEAWAREGKLRLTPGDVVDFGWIGQKVAELADHVAALGYDERFAQEFTRRVEEEHGIARRQVSQTARVLSDPITRLEALMRQGKFRIQKNPVARWQAGNCRLVEDSSGGLKIAKPRRENWRTIDGVSALLCALAARESDVGGDWQVLDA